MGTEREPGAKPDHRHAFGDTLSADDESARLASASRPGDLRLLSGDGARFDRGVEHARGGIGRVVNARDAVLDRDVVIKELLSAGPEHRVRFEREALITARLQHPSIVPIYDAGVGRDGQPYYAMKKVEGCSLQDLLAGAPDLGARLALIPKLLAVTEAVAYAHSRRIIHRDLKPGNIMVGDYGETIVVDWGLAKDLSVPDASEPAAPRSATDSGSDATVAGQVLGTPAYMAPEQARGEDVDEQADVYALGAILYHVLSGRLPHAGTTGDEVLASARTRMPTPLADVVPEVPAELAAIVAKAMAPERTDRYAQASELAEDLSAYQARQAVGAQVLDSMRSTHVEQYSLWREMFTGLGAERLPMSRLRLYAWLHLLVVMPLVYAPVGAEMLRLRQGRDQLFAVGVAWGIGAGLALLCNVAVVAIARTKPAAVRAAWLLTAIVLVCNVGSNLLSTYPVGMVASAASFYLAVIITLYRVGGDYGLGVVAVTTSIVGFVGATALEQVGVLPAHPAMPDAVMPYYELQPSAWVVIIPSAVGMLLLFATANYAVNQSLKLHRYLTNSVLRKYLPPSLVERAARGELSRGADRPRSPP